MRMLRNRISVDVSISMLQLFSEFEFVKKFLKGQLVSARLIPCNFEKNPLSLPFYILLFSDDKIC
jgi:hypothetical protein